MNVALVNPEAFETSKEHQVAMAIHSLTSAAGCLFEMSNDAEYRDIMIRELGQISGASLAIGMVWDRVRAREVA